MASSLLQFLLQVLKEAPALGYAATADSIGTTYIDDDSELGVAGVGTRDYVGQFIYRYNLTTDDRVKKASTVDGTTNGRLTIDSIDNYVDQADLEYMLLGVHPDDLIDCVHKALRRMMLREQRVLNLAHDLDMELNGVDYWDGTSGGSSTSNCGVIKVATPSDVYSGSQSLVLVFTGAGYVRGELMRVSAGQSYFTAVIWRAGAGTGTLRLRNATAGSYIGSSTSYAYAGEGFAVTWRVDTIPPGCEEVQVEYGGDSASCRLAVDAQFGPFNCDRDRRITLPSYYNETFKVPSVRAAAFDVSISGYANTEDAKGRRFIGDLMEGPDFWIESYPRDANPYNLIFDSAAKVPSQNMLWLAARRNAYDIYPMTAIGSTTDLEFNMCMAYIMEEVSDYLQDKRPDDARWPRLKAKYSNYIVAEEVARPMPPTVKPKQYIRLSV